MSDIIIDIPKIVSPAYYPMFTSNARYLSYKGSRGSGKSVAAARKVIVDIISHSYVNWLVIRQYFGTHKDSTFAALKKAASDLGVYDLFKFTVSPLEVTYKPTGQKIFFRGLTNQPTLNLINSVKG